VNILDTILADKRIEIDFRLSQLSLNAVKERALDMQASPAFADALRSVPMGLIAEVKRRSPSAGMIRDPFDPPSIARAYEKAGAQAVSVLMDEKYFGGGESDFLAVREAVALPMLYKEFVLDPWQVWHARSIGASAVLLIAAALSDAQWDDLAGVAESAGLEVLLEVHDGDELERAVAHKMPLIGINNRNLKTFETKVEHTLELMPQVPSNVTLISESGIRTVEDVRMLHQAGVAGVLVGEHLLRKADLEQAVKELMSI
jgi:indole-3-glycerol phosphate synthase